MSTMPIVNEKSKKMLELKSKKSANGFEQIA
jgi:hypothetical protein